MRPDQMESYPVVIIGAGPAGLAAAMQLRRQGISPVVLERKQIGGLLLNANLVENYPGFVEGISGPELVCLFEAQAQRLGVEIELDEVLSVSYDSNKFRIVTKRKRIEAQLLVCASGTKPREIDEDLCSEDWGQSLYYEVYPLIDEMDKDILIIGSGDAAFDYALNLSRHNNVTILNRGSEIKALPLLVERSQQVKAISYRSGVEISHVERTRSGRMLISTAGPGSGQMMECDYILAAIGREPELSFADQSIINQMERLLTDQKLYLIGDLQNGSFRQTTIAVADGIRTAMSIAKNLDKG